MNIVGKKLAICGSITYAEQMKILLDNSGAECKYFITDFLIQDTPGGAFVNSL